MTPNKRSALGLGGCVLVPAPAVYALANGRPTDKFAVTVSLVLAEPSLRRLSEGVPIDCEVAMAQGYRVVRRYADAAACGLV